MACLHNHSCEENNCSSDWSLYKHDDLPEDPWETLLLSPSLTESPGLATRTNVVAERTDVVPTEGAAGEDTSIWSMTLRIFLATIVVNYFQWAIQDSNLAKVVTGGIVVLVTSPTVITVGIAMCTNH
ncbi:hypothetical protein OROHE_014734 [Orobanche hederae]